MPTTWPTDIVPYQIDFYLKKNTTTFESPLTRTRQTLSRRGDQWICDASFRLDRQKAQRLDALLDVGAGGSFYLFDFSRTAPYNGDPGGSVRVITEYSRGTTSISISGLPVSQSWLVAGDLLAIDGYLYRLTADLSANGSGIGTATLNRGLVAALSGSPTLWPVTLVRPRVEMRLRDDDQARRTKSYDGMNEYTVGFVEVLPKT